VWQIHQGTTNNSLHVIIIGEYLFILKMCMIVAYFENGQTIPK
jgi:hypothetical protein